MWGGHSENNKTKTPNVSTYLPRKPDDTFWLSVWRRSLSPTVPRGETTGPGEVVAQYLQYTRYTQKLTERDESECGAPGARRGGGAAEFAAPVSSAAAPHTFPAEY